MLRRLWLLFAQCVTIAVILLALVLNLPVTERYFGINQSYDQEIIHAVEKATPAVVTILTHQDTVDEHAVQMGVNWNAHPEHSEVAIGSGVLIRSDGFVLTNYHVIVGMSPIIVGLSTGQRLNAEVVGYDPETDLALLKIQAENLPFMQLDQHSTLRVGQTVLAIGNPFDVGQSVTSGIISALGRHGLGLNMYEDYIQTDAAINQGNSGGALINIKGELIGINSAMFVPEQSESFVGIGFAIPVSLIKNVLPDLMAGGQVERGFLGIVPRQLSSSFAKDLSLAVDHGVMIKRILPNSPAAKVGLKNFDVIESIDGTSIKTVNQLVHLIASLKPGQQVRLRILRENYVRFFELTVEKRPLLSPKVEAEMINELD